jgi:hypothetical protein
VQTVQASGKQESGGETVTLSRKQFDENVREIDRRLNAFLGGNYTNTEMTKLQYEHFETFKKMIYSGKYWDYGGQDKVTVRYDDLIYDYLRALNFKNFRLSESVPVTDNPVLMHIPSKQVTAGLAEYRAFDLARMLLKTSGKITDFQLQAVDLGR